MNVNPAILYPYGLAVCRVSGVMLAAPVFSSFVVPARIKIFLAVALGGMLVSARPASHTLEPDAMGFLVESVIELIVGLGIGVAFRWSLAAAEIAGELAGLQMGLGIASTIDPGAGNASGLVQSMFMWVYLVVFLALDGHHAVLRALHESYLVAPPGMAALAWRPATAVFDQLAGIFAVGLQLAACVWIPLMMITFAMALVARAFPQANLFSLSYAASLMAGMVLLACSSSTLRAGVVAGIQEGVRNAAAWVRTLVPA